MTASPSTLPALPDALARFRAVEADMNRAFCERGNEVRSLMTALVSGEHVLLLGPPGTAKSALSQAFFAATVGGSFFQVLMTKYTVPEEVFGPISLSGLEHDRYERVTNGYLPAATAGFLDEVFKANSSILNSLLTILNERAFDNGGLRHSVDLEMVVGASNELPTDDALGALYDRFVLRHWVEPIKARSNAKALLMGRGAPTVTARLQPGDLAVIREAAAQVQVTDDVADAILDLKDGLAREAGIVCSDRRWRKMVELVCARAALRGAKATIKADLMVLADAIWRTPEERPTVAATVAKAVSPTLGDALRIVDAATELYAKIDKSETGAQATSKLSAANSELMKMKAQIQKLPDYASTPELQEAFRTVHEMHQDVAKTAMAALGLGGAAF